MINEKIYLDRIARTIDAVYAARYCDVTPLAAEFCYDGAAPIPYEKALTAPYAPIAVGQVWGERWGSAWFRFSGAVPQSHAGHETAALIDICGEGCIFVDGSPAQGISVKHDDGFFGIPLKHSDVFSRQGSTEGSDSLMESVSFQS